VVHRPRDRGALAALALRMNIAASTMVWVTSVSKRLVAS
jgi:hypothetical protein